MPFLGSPITPDYIDQYHDSVLKYIRDIRSDESLDLTSDSSYITTVNLLFQRADQIAADVCGKELRYMAVLVYLLSLLKADISDTLVPIYIRFLSSERILKVGFMLDDIVDFEPLEFIQKLSNATNVTASGERWYENHGTIKLEGEHISIFDLNRFSSV